MATPKKSSKPAKAAKPVAADADKPAHVAPVVNLTQAAQSAAMLLAARRKREAEAKGEARGDTDSDHVNAATFKQMKAGLNQPQFGAGSPLSGLNKAAKPTGSPGFMKQHGQGQAGGANVARTGVPRRTSGG